MSRASSLPFALSLLVGFVSGTSAAETPSFSREVVPVLYKLGCSAGTCHGAFSGKGNFRLSLFAADPDADYREVHGGFGRRVNPQVPAQSLLLRKPSMQMPHGGGLRLKADSAEYRLILAWLEAGAPFDPPGTPHVQTVRVEPATVSVPLGSPPAALRVFAKFTDGSERDVTELARFETLDSSIAELDTDRRVTTRRLGDTNVLAHYAGQIGYAGVLVPGTLPAGAKFPQEDLSDPIDRSIVAKLRALNVVPSPVCGDSDFIRRVTLDTTGQLPTPAEVRRFLADTSPKKRAQLIDRLLNDPLHSAVWATKVCDAVGADNRTMYDESVYRIYDWFRNRFERNVPWTEIVRGALTGTAADGRTVDELKAENDRRAEIRKAEQALQKEGKKVEPRVTALEDKPWRTGPALRNTLEDLTFNLKFRVQAGPKKGQMDPRPLAQHIATAFLGVRLECAECHKHPHDRWTQQDFFGFTTAFAYLKRGLDPEHQKLKLNYINGVYVSPEPLETFPDPKTGEPLPPRVLGGEAIDVQPGLDPRLEVWKWMVAPENPYFAKSIVNRVWAHYFGRGLIEPMDSLAAANPPSHPEVIDELVRDFVAHNYDLRHLHRRLLNSAAYQRDWSTNATSADDERNYSHRTLRRMSAEQVLDALRAITGIPLQLDLIIYGGPKDDRTIDSAVEMPLSRPRGPDSYVLKIFDKPQRTQSCDCERASNPNLSQALYFYNDAELTTKIADPHGRLNRLLGETFDDNELLDELYLLTLSRTPTDEERARSLAHLGASETRAAGFEDLLWALLNRQEFVVTH